jgi:hypothetical protein
MLVAIRASVTKSSPTKPFATVIVRSTQGHSGTRKGFPGTLAGSCEERLLFAQQQ